MKKTFAFLAIMAFAFIGVIATPDEGSAVPAFARQTGNPCWACHFQSIPKLNGMGRAFKLSGFTDITQDQIEDDYLAVNGVTLPVAWVMKFRYVKTSKDADDAVEAGDDRGSLQFPDEGTMYLGGKLAENVGFAVEWPGEWANGKVVFSFPVGEGHLGVSLYGAADGPFFGIELFNTGLHRGQRQWEDRKSTSIVHEFGIADTEATGITAFYGDDMFFGAIGLWGPAASDVDTNFDLSILARGAVVIPAGDDLEVMVGAFIVTGNTTCVDCVGAEAETDVNTDMVGADVQVQGDLGGVTIEAQFMYASAGDDATATLGDNEVDFYDEQDGFSGSVAIGINPQFGVKVAASSFTKSQSDGTDVDGDTVSLGAWYNFAQNIVIQPEYTSFSGDWHGADYANKSDQFLILLLMAI